MPEDPYVHPGTLVLRDRYVIRWRASALAARLCLTWLANVACASGSAVRLREPLRQEAPLRRVRRQLQRAPVRRRGLLRSPLPAQQVGVAA